MKRGTGTKKKSRHLKDRKARGNNKIKIENKIKGIKFI